MSKRLDAALPVALVAYQKKIVAGGRYGSK
jgi:hypothetical protein